ncbi:unnamed protein product (macronuclear) [Paramecium tetraurelia]|uniref:Uncharacterized protein n=1 Tax=Paramecium tetraurelia TaxID=5888 RepID=A0BUW0_PARTE|nr:uncharacterized protein GSPATT00005573001 [Paramecium tetraurelia]CAK62327.1 unnamed protein product [Paramecium tetraurelia]|eukprot:XP_001429725.1 hypothetical protein (macronuclear) [Paramecium tetraurelia strain d4-2]
MKIHNTWFAQATYLGVIGALVFATTRFTVPEYRLYYRVAKVQHL